MRERFLTMHSNRVFVCPSLHVTAVALFLLSVNVPPAYQSYSLKSLLQIVTTSDAKPGPFLFGVLCLHGALRFSRNSQPRSELRHSFPRVKEGEPSRKVPE